jgi:short-subunit dehydrogenase
MNARNPRRISGRGYALVTGASSGIGRAFALALACRGYSVLAAARRAERLQELAKEAAVRNGTVEPIVADLQTDAGIARVMRRIDEIGGIDLLVNNAGIAVGGDFVTTNSDEQTAMIRLNIAALVDVTHRVLSGMLERKHGAILNLASVLAFQPLPHFAVYAASKAFVLSFTEALAEEVKGTGVRVVALCPGAVKTEIDLFAHNPGIMGRLPSLTSEQVVKAGMRALDGGVVVRVVGELNQFLPLAGRLIPRRVMRWLMGVIAQPPHSAVADLINTK